MTNRPTSAAAAVRSVVDTSRLSRAAGLAGALLALGAGPAAALDDALVDLLRAEFRAAATASDLGDGFQALTVFNATPGLSAASYHVDGGADGADLDLSSFKLSPSHTFAPIHGVKPYVEATFGYLTGDQKLAFDLDPPDPTYADVEFQTLSALGGVGVDFDVAEGTVLRPIFLAGYSRISDDASTSGAYAEELLAAGQGIVFDVDIDSFLVGGAIELEHEQSFSGDINFTGNLRYNHLFDHVIDASDPVLDSDSNFGVFTARAEFDGPTGATLASRELRWIAFASGAYLPGDQSDALGFSYYVELGGGIELVDRSMISQVEGLSIRSSVLVGDNVVGWTAGVSVEF